MSNQKDHTHVQNVELTIMLTDTKTIILLILVCALQSILLIYARHVVKDQQAVIVLQNQTVTMCTSYFQQENATPTPDVTYDPQHRGLPYTMDNPTAIPFLNQPIIEN